MEKEKKSPKALEVPKSRYFFGWTNLKWGIKELMNIYSAKDSTLSMGEFLLWAAAEFAVSGYIINKIQKEKKAEEPSE
jgi:uncharacterized protein HemX